MVLGLDDIGGGLGSIFGSIASQSDRDAADQAIEDSIAEYKKLNPNITAATAGPSAYNSLDPSTRQAQMDTISQLRGEISSGGMDAIDRARVNDISNATAQAGRVAANGAQQDAARRGVGGTAGLVASQMAGQQAAQAGQQAGTQAAALAEQQRQGEIAQQGQQAGATRAEDQNQAAAQDAINRFNAQQTQNASEQTFQNSVARAGGIAGANKQDYDAQSADANRAQGMGKAVGTEAGAIGQYGMDQYSQMQQQQQGGGGGGMLGTIASFF